MQGEIRDMVLHRIQIDFAKSMATYYGHTLLRCRLQRNNKIRTWIQLFVQSISATGIIVVIVKDIYWVKAVAACLSTIGLALVIQEHKMRAGDSLKDAFYHEEEQWALKERYSTLLHDYIGGTISAEKARDTHLNILQIRKSVAAGRMLTNAEFDNALLRLLTKRPVWLSVFEWDMLRAPFGSAQKPSGDMKTRFAALFRTSKREE